MEYRFSFIKDGVKTPLEYEVDGWKGYGVTFGRETNVSSVVKSYTSGFSFINSDADYLMNTLFTQGPNKRVRLLVERCEDSTMDEWKIEYTGYVDLTQLEINANVVTAPVTEGGFYKALENKWNEKYEFNLDSIVNFSGTTLRQFGDLVKTSDGSGNIERATSVIGLIVGNEVSDTNGNLSDYIVNDVSDRYIDLRWIYPNEASTLVGERYIQGGDFTQNDAFLSIRNGVIESLVLDYDIDSSVIATTQLTQTASIKYTLYLVEIPTADAGVSVNFANCNLTKLEEKIKQEIVYSQGQHEFRCRFVGSYPITPLPPVDCTDGKSYGFLVTIDADYNDVGGSGPAILLFKKDSIQLKNYNYKVHLEIYSIINKERTISAIRSVDVFRKLCEKIGEKDNITINTSAFESITNTDMLTNGIGMRGAKKFPSVSDTLSFPQGTLSTSMEEFMKYALSIYNYRLSVTHDIETDIYHISLVHHDTLYGSENIDTLENVNDVRVSVARDLLYSRIKVGYETDDDAIDGLTEYNCIFNWDTPNTEIEENEYELVSPYSAATRSIDTKIYNNYGEWSDSGNDDSKIYIIKCNYERTFSSSSIVLSNLERVDELLYVNRAGILIVNPLSTENYTSFQWYIDNDFTTVVSTNSWISPEENHTYYLILTDVNGVQYMATYPAGEQVVDADVIGMDINVYSVRRNDYRITEGVYDPANEYNVALTPRRMLNSHTMELNGCLALDCGKEIVFNNADRNAEVKSIGSNRIVTTEKAPKSITDARKYIPININLNSPAKTGLIKKITDGWRGLFSFNYNGHEVKGYIAAGTDSVTVNPMCEQASEFTLLADKDFYV